MAGKVGRPRTRSDRLLADRGYDFDTYRRELRKRGVKPVIARRNTEHGLGLGKERWVVERTFSGFTTSAGCAPAMSAEQSCTCAVVCQRSLMG